VKASLVAVAHLDMFDAIPGHFYSPIVHPRERQRVIASVDFSPAGIPGVDLRANAQLNLAVAFSTLRQELPFQAEPGGDYRYYFENGAYSYSDGISYACMLLAKRPRRVIEVGSGFTSALVLDMNDRFFSGSLDLTFIEPYPKVLRRLTRPGDLDGRLVTAPLQSLDLHLFDQLESGDVLFIDSTHVGKAGSDVNYIFSQVLPRLSNGVLVHFHDVFFPFEYPAEWLRLGRSWDEAYLLRSFLQFNSQFTITYWNSYLQTVNRSWFVEHLPDCLLNPGGSIWIQRETEFISP
jgi:hypothetical protein